MAEMDALIPPLRMEEEEESEPQFHQAGFGRYRMSDHENDKERNERTPSWLTQILQERERGDSYGNTRLQCDSRDYVGLVECAG